MTRRPVFQTPHPPVDEDTLAFICSEQIEAARLFIRGRWGIQADERDLKILAASIVKPIVDALEATQ